MHWLLWVDSCWEVVRFCSVRLVYCQVQHVINHGICSDLFSLALGSSRTSGHSCGSSIVWDGVWVWMLLRVWVWLLLLWLLLLLLLVLLLLLLVVLLLLLL